MITVRKYTEEDKFVWDAFVKEAKNATFLFQRDFMDYHNDRFEDYSLLCFQDQVLVAVFPANKIDNVVYSHKGLTYGGLVLPSNIKLFSVFEIFKAILRCYNKEGIEKVEIKVIPTFYNTQLSDELEYILFRANAFLKEKAALMVIDHQNQIRIQKNRREGVNKANRMGVNLKVENNFKDFWNQILIPNLSNKHNVSPVHTLKEIELLASRFPENIKQVNVYKGGEIVAGTTLFLTKTTIHPQYVSGGKEKNILGSLDLLYDFIINKYDQSKRYFDFNISSEDNGDVLNSGLIFWKESCGARTYTADTYIVETNSYKNNWITVK